MEDQHTKLLTPSFTATQYLTPSFTSTRASASETPYSAHDIKQEDAFDTLLESKARQEEEQIAQILESELLHDTAGNQTLQLSSREKDITISELRARNIALEERNARLHAALEEQLQPRDEEREHSLGGYRPPLTADNLLQAGSAFAQKPSSIAPDDRANGLLGTSSGSTTSSESETPEDSEELDDGGTGRTFAKSQADINRERWMIKTTPQPVVSANPRTIIHRSKFIFDSRFTFEALVGLSSTEAPILVGFDELPDLVLMSVSRILDIISSGYYSKRHIPNQPTIAPGSYCAFYWLTRHGPNSTQWTVRNPGLFACSGCARNGRACMRWVRAGVWRLLPPPDHVRPEGTGYKDDAFWIQNLSSSMFGPRTDCTIWERTEPKTKKRKVVQGLEAAT